MRVFYRKPAMRKLLDRTPVSFAPDSSPWQALPARGTERSAGLRSAIRIASSIRRVSPSDLARELEEQPDSARNQHDREQRCFRVAS